MHLLPANHPRARSVLAAARSSALLGDPRFVQVLDAVEENDVVYVVHEWLPDATELTALLATGPMEAHDAYQLVSQLSQAMAAAHREGLSHLRLTPGAVLRSSTGQYRIRGLAVNAALRGITAERPLRTDTEAIGALLYAALTHRWPYGNDAHGLAGLPKSMGLIAPDQVRAWLSTEASPSSPCGRSPTTAPPPPGRNRPAPPRTSWPRPSRPCRASFLRNPPSPRRRLYQRTTYQQGTYGRPSSHPSAVTQPVMAAPPAPLQSRAGRALKWTVSALLIAALGLGSWQLAEALLDRTKGSDDTGVTEPNEDDKNKGEKPAPSAEPLDIAGATEFMPDGSGIKQRDVANSVDGSPGTSWVTPRYEGFANFGNLPSASRAAESSSTSERCGTSPASMCPCTGADRRRPSSPRPPTPRPRPRQPTSTSRSSSKRSRGRRSRRSSTSRSVRGTS